MYKKTMTYTDFDGNERTEDFYFNLTKAELTEMDLSESGGLKKLIEKISAEQDFPKMVQYFKSLIEKSYGEKSLDGKYFIKTPEAFLKFKSTNAFSDLYMELATNAAAGADFLNNIVPADVAEAAKEYAEQEKDRVALAKASANVNAL